MPYGSASMAQSCNRSCREDSTGDGDVLWNTIVEQYGHRLRAYFRRVPCARSEQYELVHAVFVEAFLERAEPAISDDLWPWLRRIAARVSAEYKRLHWREVSGEPPPVAAADSNARAEWRTRLWMWETRLLAELSVQQRIAIEFWMDGRVCVGEARVVSRAGSTHRVHKHRALRRLRCLAETDPPPPE